MKLSNFHTHTTYCDGKDSPRELVERALELGCGAIGFSGHGYTETGDEKPYCMTPEGTEAYKKEIRSLQKEFRGRIQILLGIEKDYFNKDFSADYDYSIGSVHYVFKNGVYLPVDESAQTQLRAVKEHYNGDFYAFAEDYYRLVGRIADQTQCDIVGHFDLITKFNEKNALFDTSHPRYLAAAEEALEHLMHRGLYFEVNTGAVSRGYRKTPYPETRWLDLLIQNGEKILESSDCHKKEDLLFGIERENRFAPLKKREKE